MRVVITLEDLLAMPADEAAARWLIQRADGVTDGEIEAFQVWLARSEEHRRAWDLAQQDWAVFDKAKGDELFEAMRHHALDATRPPARFSRAWSAAAAVFVAAAAALGLSLLPRPLNFPNNGAPRPTSSGPPGTIYATAPGQVRSIVLADGSTATLNAASKLVAHVDARNRTFELLQGEVYVEVKRDTRAFSMLAGSHVIRDIGTHFDADLSSDTLRVTTLEGVVSVARAGSRGMTVDAGKQLVAARNADGEVSAADPAAVKAWHAAMLHFEDERLSAVVHELNEYSVDQLVIRNSHVADLRITGSFRAGDTDRFIKAITVLYPVRAMRRQVHLIELTSASDG